jgi:hypothetical protein
MKLLYVIGIWAIVVVCWALLAVVAFVRLAHAEMGCYVQRFSYATSINCGKGRSYLHTDGNTRDRYGRKDVMPSRRRYETEAFNNKRCSQPAASCPECGCIRTRRSFSRLAPSSVPAAGDEAFGLLSPGGGLDRPRREHRFDVSEPDRWHMRATFDAERLGGLSGCDKLSAKL